MKLGILSANEEVNDHNDQANITFETYIAHYTLFRPDLYHFFSAAVVTVTTNNIEIDFYKIQ